MRRVIWGDDAVGDLAEIREGLSEHGEDVAQVHVDRLVLAANWLVDWPQAGPYVGGGWRKWKPRRSRYLLLYRPDVDSIVIGRVRHEREDWLSEL